MQQPCHPELGARPLMPRIDLLMEPHHHADLLPVEVLRVAMLAQIAAQRLLHLQKAANTVEARLAPDRLVDLGVGRFDKPVPVDVSLNVLDGHLPGSTRIQLPQPRQKRRETPRNGSRLPKNRAKTIVFLAGNRTRFQLALRSSRFRLNSRSCRDTAG